MSKPSPNMQRADRAYRLMLIYRQSVNDENNDMQQLFADLLADLRHLGDQYAVDFDDAVRVSKIHHKAEKAGNE